MVSIGDLDWRTLEWKDISEEFYIEWECHTDLS